MSSSRDRNGEFIWPDETAAALKTRLKYIWSTLQIEKPRSILDIGCGTGEQLTAYLARLLPHTEVIGVDVDETSISHARIKFKHINNIFFSTIIPSARVFDAVIASEVIEHVDNPYAFLYSLRPVLNDNGLMIVSVPNGYGCSEMMALTEVLLNLTGIWPALKKLRDFMRGRPEDIEAPQRDSMAISPHVNFFSLRKVKSLFKDSGFELRQYQGRMLLHNFICSRVIDKSERLADWNARLGAIFPALLVSDWMFTFKKVPCINENALPVYQRSLYERVKRYLNNRRYGLAN
jgi:2-polyprenyl-3-methyl-5-hydroxy-6-metoxy-1,4-benzoquinol methylase